MQAAELIDDVIERRALRTVFQPIFSFRNGQVHGYEGLIRGPEGHPLANPVALFKAAFEAGRLEAMEVLAARLLCEGFLSQQLPGRLFINTSPMSLISAARTDHDMVAELRRMGVDPSRVVIELSESYPVDDFAALRDAIRFFSDRGCHLAVDDLGAGYAGLRVWAELQPDYVKVDRHFIESIHSEPVKREFVRSICDISQATGCQVVAEGVETEAELDTLRSLGCQFVQGYLTGRPAARPTPEPQVQVVTPVERLPTKLVRASERAGSLALNRQRVAPDTRAEAAIELFRRDAGLLALPVVDGEQVLGLLHRHALLDLFTQRYGRELHSRKPVSQFLDAQALCVDEDAPLSEVSRALTQGGSGTLSQQFIITRQNAFQGMAQTQELLERITEQQLRAARYSNPLTLLPGNVPIYEHIDELLASGQRFHVAYFDLDNFKPFNDCYGYSRGDDVIRLVGELITGYCKPGLDFVGHVGGDDFVAIYQSADWQERVERVIEAFDRKVVDYYDHADRKAGGIQGRDRLGNIWSVGMLSISVGVVEPDAEACRSHHAVAALAADAKCEAKRLSGSALFVSRRRQPQKTPPFAAQVA